MNQTRMVENLLIFLFLLPPQTNKRSIGSLKRGSKPKPIMSSFLWSSQETTSNYNSFLIVRVGRNRAAKALTGLVINNSTYLARRKLLHKVSILVSFSIDEIRSFRYHLDFCAAEVSCDQSFLSSEVVGIRVQSLKTTTFSLVNH